MWHRIGTSFTAFVCSLLLAAVTASAQILIVSPAPDFTVSAGYSNLQTQTANNLFHSHDGGYLDTDAAWTLPLVVPLQVGIGLTTSGYWDRRSIDIAAVSSDYYYPFDHLYSDVDMLELEPRVGVRLGGRTGFFAVPRLGAGLLIDSYAIDETSNFNGTTYIDTRYHTGAGVEIRPAIEAGYSWGFVGAGIDASYMYSWGDFGGLGHKAQEYRLGAFIRFSF
jgi:hypothetical protein